MEFRQQADRLSYFTRMLHHIVAGNPRPAGRRLEDRGQHAHGGRLPGPVGPQQADQLPLGHLEVELLHRREFIETLGQILGDNHQFTT